MQDKDFLNTVMVKIQPIQIMREVMLMIQIKKMDQSLVELHMLSLEDYLEVWLKLLQKDQRLPFPDLTTLMLDGLLDPHLELLFLIINNKELQIVLKLPYLEVIKSMLVGLSAHHSELLSLITKLQTVQLKAFLDLALLIQELISDPLSELLFPIIKLPQTIQNLQLV